MRVDRLFPRSLVETRMLSIAVIGKLLFPLINHNFPLRQFFLQNLVTSLKDTCEICRSHKYPSIFVFTDCSRLVYSSSSTQFNFFMHRNHIISR
ncbi:hypothetical protein M758_4G167700 [Ceratodon purpureus]|nr:hypothetical protein M758_4G167700 [Ceratodon purpureus]